MVTNQYHPSYFTVTVELAIGVTTGIRSSKIALPQTHSRITGVAVFVENITNAPNFRVELTDGSNPLIPEVNHRLLIASDAVQPDRKFLSTDLHYRTGKEWIFNTYIVDATIAGSALKYSVVLRLEGDRPTQQGDLNYGQEHTSVTTS